MGRMGRVTESGEMALMSVEGPLTRLTLLEATCSLMSLKICSFCGSRRSINDGKP